MFQVSLEKSDNASNLSFPFQKRIDILKYLTRSAKTGHICTNYEYSENVCLFDLCVL